MSFRNESGIRHLSGGAACANSVRRLPRRYRRTVVRTFETGRYTPTDLPDSRYLLATDTNSGSQPATGRSDLRALSLVRKVSRRQAQDFQSLFVQRTKLSSSNTDADQRRWRQR